MTGVIRTQLTGVARTIADLDGARTVGRPHLAEALTYRDPEEMARLAA